MARNTIGQKPSSAAMDNHGSPKKSLGFLVREVYRAQSRVLQSRISREGVTIGMWFALRVLWEEDGISQTELSSRVGINGPTTVASINSMVRAGLVERVPSVDDRRKVSVHLTDYGRALKEKLWPVVVEINSLSIRGMSDDEALQLTSLLSKMRSNLSSEC